MLSLYGINQEVCEFLKKEITHTITSLISGVFDDDICFSVLEISQGKQDNVSLIDPHLRFHITIG